MASRIAQTGKGKHAQDNRARAHVRPGATSAGAIGLGRRQLRGPAVGRRGGSGAGHPGHRVAKFKLREDGTALLFKVNVSDIENWLRHTSTAVPSESTARSASPCSVRLRQAVPWTGRWPRERSPPPTPATPAGGPTWPRCSPQSRVATPKPTCTPTTEWRHRILGRGTSPAGRFAARSGSDCTSGSWKSPSTCGSSTSATRTGAPGGRSASPRRHESMVWLRSDQRAVVREGAGDVGAAADLAVDALERVGRGQPGQWSLGKP